jgi:hypothetical protein
LSLPSAFITKICGEPDRSDTKAICSPSGDHAGETSIDGLNVRRFTLRPSRETRNSSDDPPILETSARLSPVGSNTPRYFGSPGSTCSSSEPARTERERAVTNRPG